MIQNPIHKALLTFQNCDVRYLLMGGQACILYGGAEFSRDIDFSIGIDTKNILAVKKALKCLKAETIFVPPLGKQVLRRGHACHFRFWRLWPSCIQTNRMKSFNCLANFRAGFLKVGKKHQK
ncbi:MAG: hypothetical protein HW390_1788 [Candidatus Brocadiaceae bacterium]|nr:hypothetical protein [Candidatus Brocadiaceae bacterium]